jgi:hypothetical protein
VLDGGRRRLLPPLLRGECGRGARGADLSNLDGPLLAGGGPSGDSFWMFCSPRACYYSLNGSFPQWFIRAPEMLCEPTSRGRCVCGFL